MINFIKYPFCFCTNHQCKSASGCLRHIPKENVRDLVTVHFDFARFQPDDTGKCGWFVPDDEVEQEEVK